LALKAPDLVYGTELIESEQEKFRQRGSPIWLRTPAMLYSR
jgi:hypothetical protein